MKQQVIAYLRSNRSFNEGARLYSQMPGKSMAFERQLNNRGEAPGMLEQLQYELAQLVGINEAAMRGYLSGPLAAVSPSAQSVNASHPELVEGHPEPVEGHPEPVEVQSIKQLLQADDYHALQDKVQELELQTPDRKKATYRQALLDYISQQEKAAALAAIPPNVKQAVKLREEFPFLKEKDCPEEFKILVSDRITAYHEYVAQHKKLHENLKEEEIARAAEGVVENYLENQLIYKELKHYQEKGEPLGEHPIWSQRKALGELKELGVKDLVKKKNSLAKGISTDKKKIATEQEEESPDEAKIQKWQKALAEKEWLLIEVDKLLDRIDKKA